MKLMDFIHRTPAMVAFGMHRGGLPIEFAPERDRVLASVGRGSSSELPAASEAAAGVMKADDWRKLAGISLYPSREAVITANVGPAGFLRTAGYAAGGDGGAALYARTEAEPAHEGKTQSADGVWHVLIPENGRVTVKQFGAREGEDITRPLQNAIDFAAYGAPGLASTPCEVLIDVRRGQLSDTIQVGYGLDFRTVRVRGLGQAYTDADQHMGTVLTFTATDRPVFAISGGRDSAITDLTIIGAADRHIEAIGTTGKSPTLEATWETALDEAGITRARYTPYAAVAIDPYAGTAPATDYPDVTCPSWIESSFTQYGKQRSTAPRIERVTIRGFEVGIAQTPADASQNGDFPVMRHVRFDGLKYAFSTGNTQGRVPYFDSCHFADIWTVYTNNTHGRQSGTSNGVFLACGFGAFIGNLFSLNSLAFGGMSFLNCDIESLHRIGDIAGNATGQIPVWFRSTSINFRHSDTNGHPPNVLDGNGSRGLVGFDGCDFNIRSVLSVLDCGVAFTGATKILPEETGTGTSRAKPYGQIASNALAGGIVAGVQDDIPPFEVVFSGYNLDTNSADGAYRLDRSYRWSSRSYTVPIWAGEVLRRPGNQTIKRQTGHRRPILYDRRNRAGYAAPPSRSDLVVSFNAGSLATNEQNAIQQGYRNGGVIRDSVTGTVLFIRSVDHSTGLVVAELQNNYISDGAGGYDLFDETFDLTTGVWEVIGTGVYLAPQPLPGMTTSGSATLAIEALVEAPDADYGLAVGDFLFDDRWPAQPTK